MKKTHFAWLTFCLFATSSCMPAAIFTAASATTFASAKDRTFGNTVDDTLISAKIKKEFITKGFRKLYAKIHVEVVQSRVLLTGDLESESDILLALDIVWSVNGVKEVINELKVSQDSSKFDSGQYIKDTWITSRIKASLFFNRSNKFINYNIVTQKNIVYLFGIARSEEELSKVASIASKIAGVEKVVSYVHMKETYRPDQDKKIQEEGDLGTTKKRENKSEVEDELL